MSLKPPSKTLKRSSSEAELKEKKLKKAQKDEQKLICANHAAEAFKLLNEGKISHYSVYFDRICQVDVDRNLCYRQNLLIILYKQLDKENLNSLLTV